MDRCAIPIVRSPPCRGALSCIHASHYAPAVPASSRRDVVETHRGADACDRRRRASQRSDVSDQTPARKVSLAATQPVVRSSGSSRRALARPTATASMSRSSARVATRCPCAHGIRETIEILAPIEIAVDEHALGSRAGDGIEVREIVWPRLRRGHRHRRDERRDGARRVTRPARACPHAPRSAAPRAASTRERDRLVGTMRTPRSTCDTSATTSTAHDAPRRRARWSNLRARGAGTAYAPRRRSRA